MSNRDFARIDAAEMVARARYAASDRQRADWMEYLGSVTAARQGAELGPRVSIWDNPLFVECVGLGVVKPAGLSALPGDEEWAVRSATVAERWEWEADNAPTTEVVL
jgi:hypothetical protein